MVLFLYVFSSARLVLLNVQSVGLIHFVLLYMEVRHGDRRAAVIQHPGYYPKPTPARREGSSTKSAPWAGMAEISTAHLEICLTHDRTPAKLSEIFWKYP